MLLYVERWLTAPVQRADGKLIQRERGSPQGSAISPLLANLFLHYAVDAWIAREFPQVQFERYSDDMVIHCASARQARMLRAKITERFRACGLKLNQDKTRIVAPRHFEWVAWFCYLSGHASCGPALSVPATR